MEANEILKKLRKDKGITMKVAIRLFSYLYEKITIISIDFYQRICYSIFRKL